MIELGINFHITSTREGTIFNVMQFLSLEKVTGILSVSFGRHIPEVTIYFVSGKAATAEFGAISGDDVLDVVLCQENAIKEINFAPGRISRINDKALIIKSSSLSGSLLQASKDVDKCQTRPYIYGMLPVFFQKLGRSDILLHVMYDFHKFQEPLAAVKPMTEDKQAPLIQCVLLHRALANEAITYQTPLVSIKSLRQLIEIIQPLTDKESENLRHYMRNLLPHPKATHMSIDRFYAFASAIESLAQRRGIEIGEQAKRVIHRLIQSTSKLTDSVNVAP